MQFSVIALSAASASVALAASAISQIGDGQIQAPSTTATTVETTSTPATSSATTVVPQTSTSKGNETTSSFATQTENGANQVGGAALAGLVAVGAMLI